MDTHRKLSLIERGRASDALLQVFGDKIRERKAVELQKLIQYFRGGNVTLENLMGKLSAYCALEDLESELLKEVKTGQRCLADQEKSKE